ncbi:MAG TPA: hypothetical protein VE953_15040 [Terriglobales bacterium]|nr:hypothetical protein [Terriglobales bacterium]
MSTRTTPTRRAKSSRATVQQETRAQDLRPGAIPSPEMVNVFEEAFTEPTRLLAKAWVRNVAYDKKVWLDFDLLDSSGRTLHCETQPLSYLHEGGGSGDLFLADVSVQPSTRKVRRTAAEQLCYRLYYEVGGQLFTDGVCHQHSL